MSSRELPKGVRVIHDPALAEWLKRQEQNYFWCLSQPEVQDRYAGQVVVLHERRILGSGPDHEEAMRDAEARAAAAGEKLPEQRDLLFVPVPECMWLDETWDIHERQIRPREEGNGDVSEK